LRGQIARLGVVGMGTAAFAASFAAFAWAEGVPRWVDEGHQLTGSLNVKSGGSLTMQVGRARRLTCRVFDAETITNPSSMGAAGTGEVTSFKVGRCAPADHRGPACSTWRIRAEHLPWRMQLAHKSGSAASTVQDVIEGIRMHAFCFEDDFGSSAPTNPQAPRVGAAMLEFGAIAEELFAGNDNMRGASETTAITAALF
jgi:hypothetical protein